jgi:hypothetical protein
MLVTAVGVNSQTGIIMMLLGAARSVVEEERKAAKREGLRAWGAYFYEFACTTLSGATAPSITIWVVQVYSSVNE